MQKHSAPRKELFDIVYTSKSHPWNPFLFRSVSRCPKCDLVLYRDRTFGEQTENVWMVYHKYYRGSEIHYQDYFRVQCVGCTYDWVEVKELVKPKPPTLDEIFEAAEAKELDHMTTALNV